jgi:hypothetical protein
MIKGATIMNRSSTSGSRKSLQRKSRRHKTAQRRHQSGHGARPAAAYRHRGVGGSGCAETFNAPETWHEPLERGDLRFNVVDPGEGYIHPVTVDEVQDRIELLPECFTRRLEVVQFSPMTRKRALFPCYGMQWGPTVYLYPIEESLVETYVRPPRPEQRVEAKMFGGRWTQEGSVWRLAWTEKTIRDFYLNNVLIHEIGHINDERNTRFEDRERYANWFAIEYGYRVSRGRR